MPEPSQSMTRAWLALIADARARIPGAPNAAAILAAYPDLGDPKAIARHYSSDRLASDAARRGWVEPNRAALTVAPLEAAGGPGGVEPGLDAFHDKLLLCLGRHGLTAVLLGQIAQSFLLLLHPVVLLELGSVLGCAG